GIIGSVQKHISGRAMAIRRPQIAKWIEHQPKGIDLAGRVPLDVRSIRSEPVTIPRVDCDAAAVESCYGRIIVVTMIGINKAIVTPPEIAGESVRVLLITETCQQHFILVGESVPIGVAQEMDFWNA